MRGSTCQAASHRHTVWSGFFFLRSLWLRVCPTVMTMSSSLGLAPCSAPSVAPAELFPGPADPPQPAHPEMSTSCRQHFCVPAYFWSIPCCTIPFLAATLHKSLAAASDCNSKLGKVVFPHISHLMDGICERVKKRGSPPSVRGGVSQVVVELKGG